MTTYNIVFDETQYRANAKRVAAYYQAKAMGAGLPLIVTDNLDDYKYRYTYFSDPIAGSAGNEWSEHGRKGTVLTQYTDYDLYTNQLDMFYDLNDINKQGASLISQRKNVIYDKWILNVDYEDYHGPKARLGTPAAGIQLCEPEFPGASFRCLYLSTRGRRRSTFPTTDAPEIGVGTV